MASAPVAGALRNQQPALSMSTTDESTPRPTRFSWSERSDWVVEPQQERSRRTMRKILDAAATRFIEKGFDATTVADIASTAGISAGSLYRRFADKEAVLHTVLDSYFRTRVAEVDRLIAAAALDSATTESIVGFYVDMILSAYRHDADIIRLYERRALSDRAVREMAARNSRYVASRLAALLYPRLDCAMSRVDTLAAGLHTIIRGTIVHLILPDEPAPWPRFDIHGEEFERDLVRLALAWLGPERGSGAER